MWTVQHVWQVGTRVGQFLVSERDCGQGQALLLHVCHQQAQDVCITFMMV